MMFESLETLKEDMEQARKVCDAAKDTPWEKWDSCSFRRIGNAKQEHVFQPVIQRSGMQPDIQADPADWDYMIMCVNNAPAMLARMRELMALNKKLKNHNEYLTGENSMLNATIADYQGPYHQ